MTNEFLTRLEELLSKVPESDQKKCSMIMLSILRWV